MNEWMTIKPMYSTVHYNDLAKTSGDTHWKKENMDTMRDSWPRYEESTPDLSYLRTVL